MIGFERIWIDWWLEVGACWLEAGEKRLTKALMVEILRSRVVQPLVDATAFLF